MKHGLLRRICILATLLVTLSLATLAAEGNSFDYVIATTDADKMADLLDMKEMDYAANLTKGVYLDDNSYVDIAVLDTASGKWKLAAVKNFYYGDYDVDGNEFAKKIDLGEAAKYYDMIGDTYSKKYVYEQCRDALNSSAVFFVVGEQNGVYDLAAVPGYNLYSKYGPTLVAGENTTGLIFSADAPETNMIQATNDDNDAARVTLSDDTVIAVINGNRVGVRIGVQKASRSIELRQGAAYFLSANSALIIMDITNATVMNPEVLDAYWSSSANNVSVDETYFVVQYDYRAEIELLKDDKYKATMSGLFDLRTLQTVDNVTAFIERADINKVQNYAAGELLHLTDTAEIEPANGRITTVADAARYLNDDEDCKLVDLSTLDFVDGDSIAMTLTDGTRVDPLTANAIHIKVVAIGVNVLNTTDYATGDAIVADAEADGSFRDVATMEDFKDGKAYYTYTLGEASVTEITEPTEGVFDNFIVAMAGKTIVVPGADESYSDYASLDEFLHTADYERDPVRLSAYAKYDADKCTVDMVVFKLGPVAHTHDFDTLLSEIPATVFEAGEQTRACSGCGAVEKRVLPKLTAGSNIGKVTVTVTDADGATIDGALLTLTETDGTTHELLTAANSVEQPLYAGDYTVRATVFGYPLVSETFAVSAGQTTAVTLRMEQPAHADEIYATVVAFNEADGDDDVDTVTIVSADLSHNMEIAASDLGITAETPKVSYLGKDVVLLVDTTAADFEKAYDVIAAYSDAHVVHASVQQGITVENLGLPARIKWDAEDCVLTLDDNKFKNDNRAYNIELYTFAGAGSTKTNAGWERTSLTALTDNFKFDARDGYNGSGANAYGRVEYYVIDGGMGEADTLRVYYTPYEFGQYFSRSVQYMPTSKYENFVSIGIYNGYLTRNFDGDDTYFEERLVSSNYKITDSTKSVSKSNGEAAMNTKLAGETVKSGDFMFFDYNKLDNILTVAQVGSFKEGQLTGCNSANETVRIDGVDKTVAFKGAFDFQFRNDMTLFENYDAAIKHFIMDYTAGKNNVKYIEMAGNVVYMEKVASVWRNDENSFDFIIATTDPERMAALLDMTEADYADKLTKGIYIDDNGYAAIAVLDTATGKWKLAAVKNFWYGDYDAEEATFDRKINLGESAKYYDMIGETYNKAADYKACRDALNSSAVFFVVGEQNDVYDLAAAPGYNRGNKTTPNLVAGRNVDGLVFADAHAKTNKIQATNDEDDAARVTLHCETVIVVIGGNRVYVRVGRRKAAESITLTSGSAYFLAASDALIVMDITEATLRDSYVLDAYWTGDVESPGHDFVTVEDAVEPTYNAPGRTARKRCTRCGITVGGEEIPQRSARPGDVNGDDAVSKLDLLRLQKHLAGWKVEIVWTAADTNGDGAVNKADLLRLQKYLAGWDVPLGK